MDEFENVRDSRKVEDRHKDRLCQVLINQQENGKYCDLIINLKDTSHRIHSWLFFGFCPALHEKLENESTSFGCYSLNLQKLSKHAFDPIINFIYTGYLDLEQKHRDVISDIKDAANFINFKAVEEKCHKVLSSENTNETQKLIEENLPTSINEEKNSVKSQIPENVILDEKPIAKENTNGTIASPRILRSQRKRKKQNWSSIKHKKKSKQSALESSPTKNGSATQTKSKYSAEEQILKVVESAKKRDNQEEDLPRNIRPKRTRSRKSSPVKIDLSQVIVKEEIEDFSELQEFVDNKDYYCDVCDASFGCLEELILHQVKHGSPHACDICGKGFKMKSHIIHHKRMVHALLIKCPFCDLEFRAETVLRAHSTSVHGEPQPFKCDHPGCQYKGKRMEFLRRHMQTHKEIYDYTCENCGKSFAQVNGLQSHQRACYKQLPYLCDICGRAFNQINGMTLHRQSMHFGEKPYQCDVCGNKFSDPRNLKRHKLIHNNVFPYCCEICGNRFRHSNSLKDHMKRHSGKNTDETVSTSKKEEWKAETETILTMNAVGEIILQTSDSLAVAKAVESITCTNSPLEIHVEVPLSQGNNVVL